MKFIKSLMYKLVDIFFPQGITRNINGTKIKFPAEFSRFYRDGYERENFNFAAESLPDGGTVIDIGAHLGLFAVHFSRLNSIQGKVFTFEPSPFTFSILKKVIKLNKHYGEIIAYPFAVADKEGEIKFNIFPGLAHGANTLASMDKTVQIIVKTISVDKFRKEKQLKIDFIKIDAEGAEYLVLCGARETFMKDRPRAILGLHPGQIKRMGSSLDQIWDLLMEYLLTVQAAGIPVTKEWFCGQADLFDVELIPQ